MTRDEAVRRIGGLVIQTRIKPPGRAERKQHARCVLVSVDGKHAMVRPNGRHRKDERVPLAWLRASAKLDAENRRLS